ncbi:hypothetical protein SAMN04489727_8258 [Amycolatopsis tolypomycina]|uniref:Uncharacterized protein n=1 Tax=Amycolatopsis tolypomycina TaxID=208445 RepID=A0A1H5BH88_9PSEU|nr:hypothetical protein SAMN04489727_8258 [Amycolatopsis tolypomycina]
MEVGGRRPAPVHNAPVTKLPNDTPFPFRGRVVWLTPAQGGRTTGPPQPAEGHAYAANAFVPPNTAVTGLASFVLRGFEPGASVSAAEGRWLTVENSGAFRVEPGTVVVITEGPEPVGYFHIERAG